MGASAGIRPSARRNAHHRLPVFRPMRSMPNRGRRLRPALKKAGRRACLHRRPVRPTRDGALEKGGRGKLAPLRGVRRFSARFRRFHASLGPERAGRGGRLRRPPALAPALFGKSGTRGSPNRRNGGPQGPEARTMTRIPDFLQDRLCRRGPPRPRRKKGGTPWGKRRRRSRVAPVYGSADLDGLDFPRHLARSAAVSCAGHIRPCYVPAALDDPAICGLFPRPRIPNAFYRRNLAAGQKGPCLSPSTSPPTAAMTQTTRAWTGDVGHGRGVAIDSILDMRTLFLRHSA